MSQEEARLFEQLRNAAERASPDDLKNLIALLSLMPHFAFGAGPIAETEASSKTMESNEQFWHAYNNQHLRDTNRIHLDHFHLFEWFPIAPGRYHTEFGAQMREIARHSLVREEDGFYYNPEGKAAMVKGGIGTIRLKTRLLANIQGTAEPYAFMTASSSGTCHEGIPVLVPRRLYSQFANQIIDEGGIPVSLTGELRVLPETPFPLFDQLDLLQIPNLILHADKIEVLDRPRANVTKYKITPALAFMGSFRQQEGVFMTFINLDPATQDSRQRAIDWLGQYVNNFAGQILTDFDEQFPQFENAPFALKRLMEGQLEPNLIQNALRAAGYRYIFPDDATLARKTTLYNQYVNVVGPRGVLVQGNVGGSIITGDNNRFNVASP